MTGVIAFRPGKKSLAFLAERENKNAFLTQLVRLAVDGKLNIVITDTPKETKVELAVDDKSLDNSKKIAAINKLNQATAESIQRTRLFKIRADYEETFHKPLPDRTARALRPELAAVPTVDGQHAVEQIQCPDCDKVLYFSDRATFDSQLLEMQYHNATWHQARSVVKIMEMKGP